MTKAIIKRLGMEKEMIAWIKNQKRAGFRIGDRVKLIHPSRRMSGPFDNRVGTVQYIQPAGSGKELLTVKFDEPFSSGPWYSSRFKRI